MAISGNPSSPDPTEVTVAGIRAMFLAGQRFRQAMADHFSLTVSATVVLSHLSVADGQLTSRDLRDRMLTTSGTLSAIVDRLVGGGFVSRLPNPDDRRSTLITLNPAGRRVLAHSRDRLGQAVQEAFDGDPPAEFIEQLWRTTECVDEVASQEGLGIGSGIGSGIDSGVDSGIPAKSGGDDVDRLSEPAVDRAGSR